MRQAQPGRDRAAELGGRQVPLVPHDGKVNDAGLQGGLPPVRRRRLARPAAPAEFGGQGLPKTIGAACVEMLNSANPMSFALCPLLTDGAIEGAAHRRHAEQQATFIPKMVSGQWTGTMNLTEPQAGSDLALVRTRAEPQPDGTYGIFGTRSSSPTASTTWRTTSFTSCSPRRRCLEGVKGISLFIEVPRQRRRLAGARATTHCVHRAQAGHQGPNPTPVLQFGDKGGRPAIDRPRRTAASRCSS